MISILIPVFNRSVVTLVAALHSQLATVELPAEIIVMDDASADHHLKNENNYALRGFANVTYIELPVNTGRNIIRHKLAAAASYDTLIFLDADSSLPDTRWLQRYVAALPCADIIMGGRLYKTRPAVNDVLHFRYGQLREQCTAAERNQFPWRSFLACNFLISRRQLALLIIDDHLQGYCHEDTFMGLQFEQLNIPVRHIDNPVYHEGIDEDKVFMNKQQEALENLQYLYSNYKEKYNFPGGVKLIRVYKKITATRAGQLLLDKLAVGKNYCRQQALQTHRLFWLDLWKLTAWHLLTGRHAR